MFKPCFFITTIKSNNDSGDDHETVLRRLQLQELESVRRYRSKCPSDRLKRLKINKGLLRDCAKNVLNISKNRASCSHKLRSYKKNKCKRPLKGALIAPKPASSVLCLRFEGSSCKSDLFVFLFSPFYRVHKSREKSTDLFFATQLHEVLI